MMDHRYVKQMDELPGRITVAESVEDGRWAVLSRVDALVVA